MTSVISWLKENSGAFYVKGFYFTRKAEERERAQAYQCHPYYHHNVDDISLKALINKESTADKQKAIRAIDRNTFQNAFHYALSNRIYLDNSYISNEYTLLSNVNTISKNLPTKHNVYERICSYNYCKCNICEQFYTTAYQSSLEFIKFTQEKTIKNVADRLNEQRPLLIATLLEPFENDDQALLSALLTLDKLGNTPLYCAFLNLNTDILRPSLQPLLARIKLMSPTDKESILLQKNQHGKNILHLLSSTWSDLKIAIDLFGENAVKIALCAKDNDNNTPLHAACLSDVNSLSKVNEIFTLLAAEQPAAAAAAAEAKEFTPPLQGLFQKNREGKNPLHIAAQKKTNTATDASNIFAILVKALNNNPLYAAKLIECDSNNSTVLNYAVQSGSVKKVESLVEKLTAEQIMELAKIFNQDQETPLHVAMQSGNLLMVSALIKKLNADQIAALLKIKNKKQETVLHNALQLGNMDLIEILFATLNDAQKRELALIDGKNNETTLHYARRYGDDTVLKFVLSALGSAASNKIRLASPNLATLATNNLLSATQCDSHFNSTNILFNAYNYFKQNEKKTFRYFLRLIDFKTCLAAIAAGINKNAISLPDEDHRFYAKKHAWGLFKGSEEYHNLRTHFSDVTKKEWNEFQEFLKEEQKKYATTTTGSKPQSAVAAFLLESEPAAKVPSASAAGTAAG